MSLRVSGYTNGYKIVSLARDRETRDDLIKDNVSVIALNGQQIVLYPENILLKADEKTVAQLSKMNNYDVFEIWSDGRIFQKYNAASNDNVFFITPRCNSNCIMCPSPDRSRRDGEDTDVKTLIELAQHIPINAQHLTITGGEPFLIGESIFDFLAFLRGKYTYTEFLILTNGRVFALEKYADLLKENAPGNCIIGIPLHGSTPEIHDGITRTNGSFIQTVAGIKRILDRDIRVELRIVVCRQNVSNLLDLSNMIINELPAIDHVSVMAMEMTGNAYKNRESVWIPYRSAFPSVAAAVKNLIEHGIDVKLYNFPLCTVEKNYWSLCEKSISPHKIRFAESCERCKYKNSCGGVFAGTFLLEKDELRAIL